MAIQGINFRATAAFDTDAAGETYSLGEAYPTTRGGLTFGWSSNRTTFARDRTSAYDGKFAGMVYAANGGATQDFRLDLPNGPGTYRVRIAVGDATNAQPGQRAVIKDGSTVLATIAGSTDVAEWLDMSSVARTYITWPTNAASADLTFATSSLTLTLGNTGSGASALAHISVEALGSSVVPVSFSGPVPAQSATVGTAFSLNLASYFSGNQTPFGYTLQAGSLTGTGLSLSGSVISGTPTGAGSIPGLVVRATDSASNVADTNTFAITVAAAAAPVFAGPVSLLRYRSTGFDISYPAGDGTVVGYEVSTDAGGSYTSVGTSLAPTISTPLPGDPGRVRVRAFNSAGTRSAAVAVAQGVLGSTVPATGLSGAAVLYPWLQANPAYLTELVHAEVTAWPTSGSLVMFPDSSGDYTPAGDGLVTFAWRPRVTGAATGSVQVEELNSGPENIEYAITAAQVVVGVQVAALALDYIAPEADLYPLGIVPVVVGVQALPLALDYTAPAVAYELGLSFVTVAIGVSPLAFDYLPPVAPTTEPITLAQARLHLRLDVGPDGSHPDDPLILDLIAAARQHAELFTGLTFVGGPQPVPPLVLAAMKLTLGHLYTNREDVLAGVSVASLPQGAEHLLQPFRIMVI